MVHAAAAVYDQCQILMLARSQSRSVLRFLVHVSLWFSVFRDVDGVIITQPSFHVFSFFFFF